MHAEQMPSCEKSSGDLRSGSAFTDEAFAGETLTAAAATDDATPPTRWRRGSKCGPNNTCVEVARLGRHTVGVRDSVPLRPDGSGAAPTLRLSPDDWRTLTDGLRDGRHDR